MSSELSTATVEELAERLRAEQALRDRLEAVHEAALAVTAELSVDRILQRLVQIARGLVNCRYAALGVPDGAGGLVYYDGEHPDGPDRRPPHFARFLTEGISEEEQARIGPLPRQHGILAVLLAEARPIRSRDITKDPRFGGYPAHHPVMRSFLGVPILYHGRILGSFYLTEKVAAQEFSEEDQRAIEQLAAHAAVAIANAQLYERSRELTITEERNRLARDLHDAVSQLLFSVVLEAETAAALVEHDPAAARERLRRVRDQAREALQEMRALIFQLRPPDLEADGLVPALGKHLEVLRRVRRDLEIDFTVGGERRLPAALERGLYRIAQEALYNVVKHARASRVAVELELGPDRVRLRVRDDGIGFDPLAVRHRSLGLTSMRERAEELGGRLRVASRPGAGTTVEAEAPARVEA